MKSRLFLVLVVGLMLALLPGSLFASIYGKLAGKVVDSETQEALPGANVVIEGTSLGAATNVNGEFVILNVPPGRYNIRAAFIGYQPVTMKDVMVSVDLTSTINFELPSEAIAMEEVIISAERPLVNKNSTNETHIMTSEDMENMPLRSYAGAVATNTGVVTARGDMYVRGGRNNEVAFYVDGVYSNDLRTGQQVGDVPINSLEQVNYQAGGFSAEYGFANSGVVIASSKTGAKKFNFSAEVITDEFLSQEDDLLSTYSYGYNVYNATLSGPIPFLGDRMSFFLSGEKTFRKDRRPSSGTHPVLDGDFTYDEITMSQSELEEAGIPREEWILPIKNVEGPLPNNSMDDWTLNGNIMLDLNPVRIKIGGNGTYTDWTDYIHGYALANQERVYKRNNYNYSVYGKVTHTLGSKTYYEGTAYYSAYGSELKDPIFGRNLADYSDKSDWNNNGLFTPFLPQDGLISSIALRLGSGVFDPAHPMYQYAMNRSNVLGLKFDFTHQIGTTHELKTGFEYRYNTMRRYSVTRAYSLAGVFSNNPNVDPLNAYRAAYTENFGYPAFFPNNEVDPGNTLDEGPNDAKHPVLGAFYIQDKIELSDLVLNLGLRADYMDANDKKPADFYDVEVKNGTLDPEFLVDTETHLTISPRIGLSFPVTDRTVFHAQWGKFSQQPELQFLYTGWDYYAGQLLQGNYVDIGNPDLGPVKTTSYEIGIGQQLGLNSSLSATAYYKEIKDLVVLKNRVNAAPSTYAQYQNGDYGTVKGLSLTYKLRRTNRVAANVSYTMQWAKGTGSTSSSNFYVAWIGDEYYPIFVSPLDYDQRHTLSLNVDFRTNPEDGPEFMGMRPLGNVGLNVLANAGSGFPYTPKRIADTVFQARNSTAYPIAGTNSAYTNWTHNINVRLDKKLNVAGVDFNVYLWVLNLLDSKQPFNRKNDRWNYTNGIYEATGQPDDNGWLNTNEGQKWVESNGGERAADLYQAFINSPENRDSPRQVRLGLRFNITP